MQKILHFHIPKTGGIAIRQYLIEQLGEQCVSPSVLGNRLSDALLRWRDMRAISGHFSLYQGDQLPVDRCNITVLRNPIDRFLSQYFFEKSDNADRLLDAKVHALDLDDYLENLSIDKPEAVSCQMGMLYPLGTSSRTELSTNEKYEAAVRSLELFELVGIQDELDDFSSMLDARFSWKPVPLRFKNVASQRLPSSALSASQQSKLNYLLECELELYQQAKARFKQLRRNFIRTSVSMLDKGMPLDHRRQTAAAPTAIEQARDFGDRRCSVLQVSVEGEISGANHVMVGEHCNISISFKVDQSIDELNIGIAIKDEQGSLIFGTNTMLLGNVYAVIPGEYCASFQMLNRAPIGRYVVDVALVRSETHYQGCYHWLEKAASFQVHETAAAYFEGQILMDANVELVAMSPSASWSSITHVPSNSVMRSLGRNNKPLSEFASKITPMCSMDQFYLGLDVFVPMHISNISGETWNAFGQQPVTLSYRWLTKDNEVIISDGLRTRLPTDVPAGGSIIVPMKIRPPSKSGEFQLVLSLVQESVAWFVDKAPQTAHITQINLA
ncbi:Wzt carbohydrate-binding domain-containing protein [Dyella humi]|uniref:Wzt carbohydrate-binding domain-containing protein n=1 Tax=Dyella humi TaxID=1770547 RepID=A0ABW8IM52_9GAMM